MNNIEYWEKRAEGILKNREKDTEKYINNIMRIYDNTQKEIDNEVQKIFNKYAIDGKLSEKEAKKLLNTKENKDYYDYLLRQINKIKDEDVKRDLLNKYNASAYSYRIGRLEALKNDIYVKCQNLAQQELNYSKEHYINTYNESYKDYQALISQNISKQNISYTNVNSRVLNNVLNTKWLGSDFSKRIWKNAKTLSKVLNTTLTTGILAGHSIQKMSKELNDTMKAGMFCATRLIRTETNYFHNQAELQAYIDDEIENYKYLAILDNRTSKVCSELNNKIFKVEDAKVGENYPPMHPFCRSTTIPVFEEELQTERKDVKIKEKKQYKKLSEEEQFELIDIHRNNITNEVRKSIYKTDWDNMQEANKYGYINSNYSGAINYLRRTGETTGFTKKEVKEFSNTINNLRQAISNNKLKEDIQVTRYLDLDWLQDKIQKDTYKQIMKEKTLDQDKLILELLNKTVPENQFISASINQFNVYDNRKIKMIIDVDKGTNAFITENKMESEIIFDDSDLFIEELELEKDVLVLKVKLLNRR